MTNNPFFKPTPLYKEFMILDMIEKDPHITQRQMSQELGVAVSMVNSYLDTYEEQGYLKREYKSSKSVEYLITKSGIERRKLLNIWYLKSTQQVYSSAINNIQIFLNQVATKGFRKILLYGAGEVAEILLQAIENYHDDSIEILAMIDDDEIKVGKSIHDKVIISLEQLSDLNHDGVLISSYTHHSKILKKLNDVDYEPSKIIEFF